MNAQEKIISELGVKPTIDPESELQDRIQFLSAYLAFTGLKGFVLGISGGQDSLLAGILAQKAVEKRRSDGFEATFHAVLLPYGTQSDRDDAELAIKTIKPDAVHDLDIRPSVDAFAENFEIALNHPIRDFDKGNVKARQRMVAQYALAGDTNSLVIGTDHAAEAVTGFYTKFGDGGADVLPLSGLDKRQGRELLKTLHVPEIFITKKPTADLLDTNPGQTDETELGLSYDEIDDYLEGKTIPENDARRIEARYDATTHKRRMPVAYTDKSS